MHFLEQPRAGSSWQPTLFVETVHCTRIMAAVWRSALHQSLSSTTTSITTPLIFSFWHICLRLLELADVHHRCILKYQVPTKLELPSWEGKTENKKEEPSYLRLLGFAYHFKRTCLSSPPLFAVSLPGIQSGNF